MGIKVLHCADLHLDAVLGGSVRAGQNEYIDEQKNILLRDAPLLALKNVADVAISENVDLVLIAGDLFNSKEDAAMNHRVRAQLLNFFKTLNDSNIKICIAVGNHDPLKYILEISASWPENVFLFKNNSVETFLFEINNQSVAVHGVSYATQHEDRDLASTFPKRSDTDFNFGVLHTNVGGDLNHSNYAPSELKTLCSYDYDYFALGHIHKRGILSENPLVAYSGNHQAFSPKPSECEPKGVIIIELESSGSNVDSKFIATDVVRYANNIITIGTANSVEEIAENICAQLEDKYTSVSQLILCRLHLKLENFEGTFIDCDDLTDIINESIDGIIVTNIKIDSRTEGFEELAEMSEYFQTITNEINCVEDYSFDDLYGKHAAKIKTALSIDESFKPNYIPNDIEREIKEYISTIHNELTGKVKQ